MRRFFAPEVVQATAVDCGPAALKILLGGFGVQASYERLREACHTGVDGTSIDAIEEAACALGLDAEQGMLPVDHLLLREADALPAIVVTRTATRFTHFVVVWRAVGPWLQIGDPAAGRRWVRATAFEREVMEHVIALPAGDFRAWASRDGFLRPLRARMRRVGVGAIDELVSEALADESWRGIAALDAAVRAVEDLTRNARIERTARSHLVRALFTRSHAEAANAVANATTIVPRACWLARSATPGVDGEPRVLVRGAVTIHVRGLRPRTTDTAPLPLELATALAERPVRPGRDLLEATTRASGGARVASLAALATIVGALASLEVWLAARAIARPSPTALALLGGAWGAHGIIAWLAHRGARTAGARVESALWRRFAAKIPRLEDAYFQSRPMSDLAIRAHRLGIVRDVSWIALATLEASLTILASTFAIAYVDPRCAAMAALLAVASLAWPFASRAWLAETHLRVEAQLSAIGRTMLETLRGTTPLRAHAGEAALRHEMLQHIGAWTRAARSQVLASAATEALFGMVPIAIALSICAMASRDALGVSSTISVALWALLATWAGRTLAARAREWIAARNTFVRLVEPLGAPESKQPEEPASQGDGSGVALSLRGVSVRAAGHTVLDRIDLDVRPGEHIAIVGRSGAGKSSLVGLLLGWHIPFEGEVRVDGVALDAGARAALRRRTAWVDPSVQLWNRSLRENVAYGETDDAPLDDAIDRAGLRAIHERWPDGDATTLGEGGGRASGGEGQRVRVARVFARRGVRLAILDEAFRGLERDERAALLGRARAHWQRATLLCITHDVRETMDLDRVLVVDGGRIVEDGPPRELASRPTRYKALLDAEEELARELAPWRRVRLVEGALREERDEERRVQAAIASARPPPPPMRAPIPAWPANRASEAVAAIARDRGWPVPAEVPDPEGDFASIAHDAGLEAESVAISHERFVEETRRGTLILRVASGEIVAVSGGALIAPDGSRTPIAPEALRSAFFGTSETKVMPAIEALLDAAKATGVTRSRMRDALLARAIDEPLESCVRLRVAHRVHPIATLFAVALAPDYAAIALGGVRKRAHFEAALIADADALRADGIGHHVGRILSAGAFEARAATALDAAIEASVALVIAVACFAWAHAGPTMVLLFATLAFAPHLAGRYARALASSTSARLELTYDLVEEMSGQRTRIAQLPRERWHEREDVSIALHEARSNDADRARLALFALGTAWLVLAAPLLSLGTTTGTLAWALAIAGVLLGRHGLDRVAVAASCGVEADDARGRAELPTSTAPSPLVDDRATDAQAPLLEALALTVEARGMPVLTGCSLRIERGDRVLLEGASGSGKSTLVAILASLRAPASGETRLRGRSSRAIDGRAWRRAVVAVPQFHDNHVFTETLAFNALIGRGWPPRDSDLADAEAVCRDLGLGDLLDRMPGGLEQMVGETGWQLSHGEQSRVFIARALLQRGEVLLFDESVAALDPDTLAQVLATVRARAETIVLVAHP